MRKPTVTGALPRSLSSTLPFFIALSVFVPSLAARAQVVTITPLSPTPTPSPKPRPRPRPTAPPKPVFQKPILQWKTFLRRVDGTPAIANRVSFLGAEHYLYQIDSGGRTLWATEIGQVQSSPCLDALRAYIGSDQGILYGINRQTGKIDWQFNSPAGSTGTILTRPTVAGGLVFAESTDNNVYAVEAATGKQRWKFTRTDGSLGYASPLYDPLEKALYVCGETTVYRLDPANGKPKWQAYVGGKSTSSPEIGGSRVYVGGDGTGLSAYSASSGAPLWNFRGEKADDWFGPPLYAAATVYVSTYNRYVYAVDAATGKSRWSYRLLGASLSQPAIDAKRGVLYIASTTFRDNPTLTALDMKTGKPLWTFKAAYVSGSPIIADDRLYLGSTSGYYYAFSLSGAPSN